MVDRLTAVAARVGDQPESVLTARAAAQLDRDAQQSVGKPRVLRVHEMAEIAMVRDGQHEQVGRSLRLQVFDRDEVVVPVRNFRGNLTGRDLTEYTVVFHELPPKRERQRVLIANVQLFVVVFPAPSETRTVTRTGPSG